MNIKNLLICFTAVSIVIYALSTLNLIRVNALYDAISGLDIKQAQSELLAIEALRESSEADLIATRQAQANLLAKSQAELEQIITDFRNNNQDISDVANLLAKHNQLTEQFNQEMSRLALLKSDDSSKTVEVVSLPTDWMEHEADLTFCTRVEGSTCTRYNIKYQFKIKIIRLDSKHYNSVDALYDDIFSPYKVYFRKNELDFDGGFNQTKAAKTLQKFMTLPKGNTEIKIDYIDFDYKYIGDDFPLTIN